MYMWTGFLTFFLMVSFQRLWNNPWNNTYYYLIWDNQETLNGVWSLHPYGIGTNLRTIFIIYGIMLKTIRSYFHFTFLSLDKKKFLLFIYCFIFVQVASLFRSCIINIKLRRNLRTLLWISICCVFPGAKQI